MADQSPIRSRKSAWVTRPDVEFLNSLCPSGGAEFPEMDGFIGDRWKLQEAFRVGFHAVKDNRHATIPTALDNLGKYELKVWFAIYSRTLKFGKLFEKIPNRHFKNGIKNDDGTLVIGNDGYPIFPPVIWDHGNLSRTIKSLIEKRAISCFESQRHPQHGVSRIYTPINAVDLWNIFIGNARSAYIGSDTYSRRIEWASFADILRNRAHWLMGEISDEAKRFAAPFEEKPAGGRDAAPVPTQGDRAMPPVRKRVRSWAIPA